MIPEEPRTPYEDEESPLDIAASGTDTPASPSDTVILPPRVVAETPVGGLRPAYHAPGSAEETPSAEAEPADEGAPALEVADEGAVAEALEVASEETAPPAEHEPGEAALPVTAPEPEAEPAAAPELDSAETFAGAAETTAPEISAEIADATVVEVPDLEAPTSVVSAAIAAVEEARPEPETAAPTPEVAERLDSEQEWDEDLSPALAAVLFGSPRRPPVEAAPETAPAAESIPVARPRPAASAGPIRLKEEGEARTLPLTAGQHVAPAPDVTLSGKVRYTRLEEPLKNDAGQRVVETWDYFKPDYPGLDGQLVCAVRSEEERFSDGSWRWRYERQYADRGRDRREVRANADRTYFERADEIALRDPETGKRQQIKEEAGMIFAPPPREEKRGLLSSLLRRDDDKPAGPAAWREATPGEMRQAGKDGGQAFKRGLFG